MEFRPSWKGKHPQMSRLLEEPPPPHEIRAEACKLMAETGGGIRVKEISESGADEDKITDTKSSLRQNDKEVNDEPPLPREP